MTNNIVNLIRKDYRALLSEKLAGIMLIILLVISSVSASQVNFLGLFLVFITVNSYIPNIFGLEEKYRTEKFFISLPVRRSEIVLARYGEVIVIAGAYIVLAYLANSVLKMFSETDVRSIPAGYWATAIMIVSFVASLIVPFYFKFGRSRAKTLTVLLMVLTGFALSFFVSLGARSGAAGRRTTLALLKSPFPNDAHSSLFLMGIAILFLVISIPISVGVYSKKDL